MELVNPGVLKSGVTGRGTLGTVWKGQGRLKVGAAPSSRALSQSRERNSVDTPVAGAGLEGRLKKFLQSSFLSCFFLLCHLL